MKSSTKKLSIGDKVIISLVILVLGGMLTVFYTDKGFLGKEISTIILMTTLIVFFNLFQIAEIVHGGIYWRGGGGIALKTSTPIRFWCIWTLTFISINSFIFILVLVDTYSDVI